ncbi:hypothetical protein GCM10010910_26950 [Microbacterium nanhaiense]|uniref:VTT domain-containing protein n=1 Tax=Microbacterium nanhaiense TaxID=1301026 RepID=A0ABQ2N4D9_9MICO|nr:DedA family protein [Microbacterium nanhaiense]GGO66765.1 hypothetical protein GCM10010910_26950 [Microbacterium nanhaiense]
MNHRRLTDILAAATDAAPEQQSWLGALVEWAVSLMDLIGPIGVGIAIAFENIFPPIPSEAILPAAGFAAHQGAFGVVPAIAWATAGSLVGALALYLIGMLVGVARLRWLFDKIPLLRAEDIDKTVAWFTRHGSAAVFFGRFLPIFRSLISIPAGVVRMPIWRFLLYTGLGSLIWNTVFIMIGWFLGSAWHVVEEYMGIAQNVVIVVVAALLVWFVVARVRQIRRERETEA